MSPIRHGEVAAVNAQTDISAANRFACVLEDAEARRLGLPVVKARNSLARKLGTSPGTLEGIRRLRSKAIPSWLMARIRAAFVAELQSQILALEHEIHIARQTGADPRDDDVLAAAAALETARALLGRK